MTWMRLACSGDQTSQLPYPHNHYPAGRRLEAACQLFYVQTVPGQIDYLLGFLGTQSSLVRYRA
jgi:hypothetical protein